MAEVLQVAVRDTRGKHNARRMRHAGRVPAVLYGHGQEVIALTVPGDALRAAVRHGSRVVELSGAVNESALIREMQWDVWGAEILHVDFARVSADETVELTVPIELRGEAPGIREGGVVEHLIHEIEIECRATAIPEKLVANINKLKLGDAITLAEMKLPDGAVCHGELDAVVVHCIVPVEVTEEEEVTEAAEGEPEVIGERKEEEEKEGDKQ